MKTFPHFNEFSLKGGGWDEQRQPKMQSSAQIVRVECAKCRPECDLSGVRATPRRSCVSSARNAGESAICPMPAQPSAEIVRVECAKGRRGCDLSHARATLCGDRACRVRERQARVRFVLQEKAKGKKQTNQTQNQPRKHQNKRQPPNNTQKANPKENPQIGAHLRRPCQPK